MGRLDELIDKADEQGVRLTGKEGFLPELVKALREAARRPDDFRAQRAE